MPNLTLKQWRYLLAAIVVVDLLIVGGVVYVITAADSLAEGQQVVVATISTPTATPTPWPGPGLRPTATPTLPPTPLPTTILGPSGFPHGFTPTPRPTREPVFITLPQIYPSRKNAIDVPVINQIHYPEPFFPPGTNNACGPVSLYAALQGLGVAVDYGHLRNVAVNNGFNTEGISKWGMINTILSLNSDLGNPLTVEYGNRYNTKDLIRHLRQGGVVVVLVQVRRGYSGYQVTGDPNGSIGHFLLVENLSTRSKRVKFAGSTLGMDQVSLIEFLRSWTGNPQLNGADNGWRTYLKNEPAVHWALILKRS